MKICADMIDGTNGIGPGARHLRSARPKLLVVDDDLLMVSVLCDMLGEAMNAEMIECESGEEAWSHYDDDGDVQLIITDRDMPGMDGLELAARIHERDHQIPILLVTAHGDDLDPEKLRGIGIVDVLLKPFTGEQLLAAVSDICPRPTNLALRAVS